MVIFTEQGSQHYQHHDDFLFACTQLRYLKVPYIAYAPSDTLKGGFAVYRAGYSIHRSQPFYSAFAPIHYSRECAEHTLKDICKFFQKQEQCYLEMLNQLLE